MTREEYQHLAERMVAARKIIDKIRELEALRRRALHKHLIRVYAKDENDEQTGYGGPCHEFGKAVGVPSDDPFYQRAQERMIAVLVDEIDLELAKLEAALVKV